MTLIIAGIKKRMSVLDFLKEHRFLFFTYLIILFIPLFAFVFYIANVDAIMRRDARQYQSSLLQREKLLCDSIFRSGRTAASTVASNTDARHLSGRGSLSPADRWTVSTLSRTLSDMLLTNSYIESIGVYFYKNDSFVTNGGRYVPVLYRTYLSKYGLSPEEFLEATAGYSGFFITRSGDDVYLLIYQNTFNYSLKERTAVSYAIIPWTRIQQETTSLEPIANETFFVLTQNATLFAGPVPVFAHKLPDFGSVAQSVDNDDEFISRTQDAAFISAIASDELNLYYGIYLSRKDFYRDIDRLFRQYLAGVLISLLIGTMAAFYFTGKNSAPLRHLLSLVNDSGRKNASAALSGGYRRLEEALLTLQKDNRSLVRHLDERRETMFEATLSGFFKGIYPNEDWILNFHEQEPQLCGIGDYRIALFCFSNIETSKFIRMQKESLESYSLLFFSLKNVIDEVFLEKEKKDADGISIVMDSMVACILPAGQDEGNCDSLTERADQCLDFFRKLFELDCCVAVSDRHSLWTELADAYDEAYMAASHTTFLKEEASVNFYCAGRMDAPPDGTNLLKLKKNLAGSLMINNYTMARELVREIMNTCFLRDIRYFPYNQCQANALISMLLDKLSDMGMEDEVKAGYSARLLGVRSTAELEEVVEAIFAEILDYQNRSVSDNEWAESVKAYIRENYCSPELNVTFIAEHFEVSAAHIGNRFRKLTGVGILDYVHMIRLAKCKEMLAQGSTIKYCADATGYTDIKTLQRAFKRYEGITPGQYKESILKEQSTQE